MEARLVRCYVSGRGCSGHIYILLWVLLLLCEVHISLSLFFFFSFFFFTLTLCLEGIFQSAERFISESNNQ